MAERSLCNQVEHYDVAVIGAGVVGCAVFRALVLGGLRCILIERDGDILAGASRANSAILHTGFDAVPGSLEAACVREGYRLYERLHETLGLPMLRTGALVVAWTADQQVALDGIAARALDNGITNLARLDAAAVLAREPQLARDLKGGLLVPDEAVIDSWSAPLAYALHGMVNGGTVWRRAKVTDGTLENGIWTLTITGTITGRTEVRAATVINCAGNHGDLVEAIARPSPFAITPRKGQFVVFDKSAHDLVTSIILPVPTERTKGVVVTRTAYGSLLVGPTAEDQSDRTIATVEAASLDALKAAAIRMVPALATETVTTAYAGLRPATQFKDYQIEAIAARRWITVGGIRSTGLSGALGIAAHVARLYAAELGVLTPLADPMEVRVPNLTEGLPRPFAQPGRSEIVCHCEGVTRGEIEAALTGPLPAGTLGGLRRRTRCMMGRCQGFYCTRRVMELASPIIPGLVEPMASSGRTRCAA